MSVEIVSQPAAPAEEEGLFRPASAATFDLIRRLNQERRPTFLIPTKFISAEAAQVGLLFDRRFNGGRAGAARRTYKSFFANSRFEALQGAIKIARHRALMRKGRDPEVLVHDPAGALALFVDPLGRGPRDAFLPGIRLFPTLAELARAAAASPRAAGIVVHSGPEESAEEAGRLLADCRARGFVTVLDESGTDLAREEGWVARLPVAPDVVVTGEELTGREIPFGAFSMTDDTYRPWNTLRTCLLHSSTYSGNVLALSRVRDRLLAADPGAAAACEAIAADPRARLRAFSRHVNPRMVRLYAMTGLDLDPVRAEGAILTLREAGGEERQVLDCVSGGGAVIRGHAPADLVPEVLETHDPAVDYPEELRRHLAAATGLPCAFPAVSGATAVEIAMSLALLANPDRRRIVTFVGNYAGKILLPLIGSEGEGVRDPFHPLYPAVVYIDPFAADAAERLARELTSGEVALVWFEVIQGGSEKAVPQPLLDLIERHRAAGGYLVGVDEILTGIGRTGRFLAHPGRIGTPDLLTLSKALSDGSFPTAVALAAEQVRERAAAARPDVVAAFERLYRHPLAAHIALHLLRKVDEMDLAGHVRQVAPILGEGLRKMAAESPLIRAVRGEGLLYCLEFDDRRLPVRMLGSIGSDLLPLFLCRLCLEQAGVFLFFERCIPPLTLSAEQARRLVDGLGRVFGPRAALTYLRFTAYIVRTAGRLALDALTGR